MSGGFSAAQMQVSSKVSNFVEDVVFGKFRYILSVLKELSFEENKLYFPKK